MINYRIYVLNTIAYHYYLIYDFNNMTPSADYIEDD